MDRSFIIIITIRGFIVRLLQCLDALESHPNCQQIQKSKLKVCLKSFSKKSGIKDNT